MFEATKETDETPNITEKTNEVTNDTPPHILSIAEMNPITIDKQEAHPKHNTHREQKQKCSQPK